jgi:hypothetical protein
MAHNRTWVGRQVASAQHLKSCFAGLKPFVVTFTCHIELEFETVTIVAIRQRPCVFLENIIV